MAAGGDIGGADQRHQRRIVRIANAPAAERFSHVAIDVDDVEQCLIPLLQVALLEIALPATLTSGER
ncbi:hypothetical protein D3C86_2181990 [compost metagenome]